MEHMSQEEFDSLYGGCVVKVRTEADFVKEYGPHWRSFIPHGWNEKMDNLFDKELHVRDRSFYNEGILVVENDWIYSKEMFQPNKAHLSLIFTEEEQSLWDQMILGNE